MQSIAVDARGSDATDAGYYTIAIRKFARRSTRLSYPVIDIRASEEVHDMICNWLWFALMSTDHQPGELCNLHYTVGAVVLNLTYITCPRRSTQIFTLIEQKMEST